MKGFVILLLLFPTNERFCDSVIFVPYSIRTKVTNFGYNFNLYLGLALCLELDGIWLMRYTTYHLEHYFYNCENSSSNAYDSMLHGLLTVWQSDFQKDFWVNFW